MAARWRTVTERLAACHNLLDRLAACRNLLVRLAHPPAMGKPWRPVAGIIALTVALILALTGCAERATTSPSRHGAGSASRSLDEQEKANRKQAEDEARRLFELARIPPGAVALQSAPAALAGPSVGTPAMSTYASLARFWRVPMSFAALDEYVRRHPPAGLTSEGDGSTRQHGLLTSHGYAWQDDPSHGSPQGGQLSMSMAPAVGSSDVSYLRVDAGSEWLDPHPVIDSMSGTRLRLETGQSCPASGIGGVRNDGADDLDGVLAPNATPASGRVCVYAGGNGQTFALLRQRTLPRAEAARVAAAAHAVDLAHPDGVVIHCPAFRGSTFLVVLSYPSRSAVDLLVDAGGCSSASNGHVVASQSVSLSALIDLVSKAAG